MAKREDYYETTGQKTKDFLLGFFGIWLMGAILTGIFYLIFLAFPNSIISFGLSSLFSLIELILAIGGIIYFRRIGRRYIAIGIITSIVLPILIFGACLAVLFAGGGGF